MALFKFQVNYHGTYIFYHHYTVLFIIQPHDGEANERYVRQQQILASIGRQDEVFP
jgi:hypothetical protein